MAGPVVRLSRGGGGDLVKGQSAAGLLVYDDNESLMATRLHILEPRYMLDDDDIRMPESDLSSPRQLRPSEATSYGLYNYPG